MSPLTARFRALPAPPLETHLTLRPGTIADYATLAQHHYRAARPATIARILTLDASRRTASQRFRGESGTSGGSGGVAVLIESMPALACRLRDLALNDRHRHRPHLLNAEVRCISRVIVHPQWRGLGLAVRLVRAALASATTPYTEALAAMGAVNPFFEKAGMTAYRRPPTECDARLTAALARAGIAPANLALLDETCARIDRLPGTLKAWLRGEIRRWHARTHRAKLAPDHRAILLAARQRLLSEPVYFLHLNPRA